jgi:hypothetical protein
MKNSPDLVTGDNVANLPGGSVETLLVAHNQANTTGARRCDNAFAFSYASGHGLFQDDVLASPGCRRRDLQVTGGRCANAHSVYRRIREKLTVIGSCLRDGVPALCFMSARDIGIADPY